MPWFDQHCHLELDAADAAIDEARASGVLRMVCVGTDEGTSHISRAVARSQPGTIWATAGVHPHDASQGWAWLQAFLAASETVAVGECGLDYHYDYSPRGTQQDCFTAQIEMANRLDLPLVIHTREAWEDTFRLLDAATVPRRMVFHCFTGGEDEARECLARGGFLSFSGIVSFPKAADVQAAARYCPLDRLLVETDSPYLAPVPHRGKRNQPAWVSHVGAAIARLKEIPIEQVADATWFTTNTFYGLTP